MADKKRRRTERQHYVPRCYLKRFSANGKTLWCFNKFDKRMFEASLWDVAQETRFYDLPAYVVKQGTPDEPIDPQAVELALSRVETCLNVLLEDLLDGVERRGIPREYRPELAVHVAVQWLRTREQREAIFEGWEKLYQAAADEIARVNFPDLPMERYPRVVCGRDNLPAVQAGYLFNEDRVVAVADRLARHVWVVGINKTNQTFYTSDHSVVTNSHALFPSGGFAGIGSPRIEVAFPLTSRHILVMWERTYFRGVQKEDGRPVPMGAYGVEHYNKLQTLKSYRQVYCEMPQFEHTENVCRRHPEVCSPDRDRLQVNI
jgi:hypothetical protein